MRVWYITKKSLIAGLAITAAIIVTNTVKWAASHIKE